MSAAGKRDRLIRFDRYATTENDHGEPIRSTEPTELGREMAQVIYGRGEERRQAAKEGATKAATFRVLSTSVTRSINVGDVISFEGDWDIESIAPDTPKRGEIEITTVGVAS